MAFNITAYDAAGNEFNLTQNNASANEALKAANVTVFTITLAFAI